MSGCDSTTSPVNKLLDAPTVNRLTIVPHNVQFIPTDGFTDTTLTVHIETQITNSGTEELIQGYIVRNKEGGAVLFQGQLTDESRGDIYWAEIDIETSTTSFLEYVIEVYAFDKAGNGNYYQANFGVEGISNARPQLLQVSNPEEVTIPSDGEIAIPFTAKVFDPDGQNNIDRVLIEFINEDGSSLIPVPNQLFDNGINEDAVQGDSVYTIAFNINSSNTPNNRKAIYFAIDKAGLHSDTLQTTFNIVEQ